MALFQKPSPPSGAATKGDAGRKAGVSWVSSLLGGREIEKRVDEDFPTWQEYSEEKIVSAQERAEEEKRVDLPSHKVYISSPLHGNFLYFITVIVALALGFFSPQLAPVLVYGAIALVLTVSLFVVFRDGLFFHIEGLRLQTDSDKINKHTHGPQNEREEGGLGFLRSFSRKHQGHKVFRSRLLQVHYQNVLRTFEQGNRRTWVDQEASISEIHTLLSQGGMKLVWTMIEVLPQLGLLGTLIGLMRMFVAFRTDTVSPELEILAGFGTALGTTVLANILVLVLRPLYMRNERSMNEILSTIQMLMATFILPTQQSVLERTLMTGFGRTAMPGSSAPPALGAPLNENRLYDSLTDLTRALSEFTEVQQQLDSGAMAKETSEIAQEVKDTLRLFQDSVDQNKIEKQQHSFEQLSDSLTGLSQNLEKFNQGVKRGDGASAKRIEHDMAQLRLLTHDTLILLEQIAERLAHGPHPNLRLLSADRRVREQFFSGEGENPSQPAPAESAPPVETPPEEEEDPSQIRLFKERS